MGTFVITKRVNGLYKYEFISRKGKTILVSDDYELRFECEEAIEVLKNSAEAIFFMRFKSKNGKMYFKVIVDEILDFSGPADVFPPAEDIFG
jgi:uncharacterized protein YegP (UPF0339 family)